MLFYGIWIEKRIFGELIPGIACVSALIAEQAILARVTEKSLPDAEELHLAMK
jgi:hypothetical protein